MADAAAPVEPKRRPAVVTVGGRLLYLAAACQVVSAVVTISQLGAIRQAYQKLFAGTPMSGSEGVPVAITAASAVGFGLLFAVGYVVLGIMDGRGKNPARIVTWVVAGLAICFSGCGLVMNAAGVQNLAGSSRANGMPSAQDIQRVLNDALPGWYQPVLTTVGIVSVLALLAAVVLLALPAANDFFRKKPVVGWEPPVPSVPPVPPPTA